MRIMLLASVAAVLPVAFENVETVLIKGQDGKPVMVNKSDYDHDQSDKGEKAMTLHKDDAKPEEPAGGGVKTFEQLGIEPVAAPSAPDFTGGGEASPLPIDPTKNAAAPVAPSPNQRLVIKEGKKFYVVDGTGTKLDIEGVDTAGYATDKAAWDAIMALPH